MGQGHIKPVEAKKEAVSKFPSPVNCCELMRFLRMAGYYRKFCTNFSLVAELAPNFFVRNRILFEIRSFSEDQRTAHVCTCASDSGF